jgi:hypothetical protein
VRTNVKNFAATVGALLLLSASVPASAKSYSVTFSTPVVIAGTELKPGAYTMEIRDWQAFISGPGTQVVALVRVERAPAAYQSTSVKYIKAEGKNVVQEVRLGRSDMNVVFNGAGSLNAASGKKAPR